MMFKIISEGTAAIEVPAEKKVSADLPVFYNPVMEENRSISIVFLEALGKKSMRVADPLAASGVRAIRFLKELPSDAVEHIAINDHDEQSVGLIKKNLGLNKLSPKIFSVTQKDANLFLLESAGFDYIDIDPFGTPNPFLDSAIRRISRGGILAVTATDTAPLAGTYPAACERKYFAKPLLCPMMHEIGLRILIRKVQIIGAQYDKALVPVISYFSNHYFRIFFMCTFGKERVDNVLSQHMFMHYGKKTTAFSISQNNSVKKPYDSWCGPLWAGSLGDTTLAAKMAALHPENKLLHTLSEELQIDAFGFYNIHAFCKVNGVKNLPTHEVILAAIHAEKYPVARSHFTPLGIRTTMPFEKLLRIIKKIAK